MRMSWAAALVLAAVAAMWAFRPAGPRSAPASRLPEPPPVGRPAAGPPSVPNPGPPPESRDGGIRGQVTADFRPVAGAEVTLATPGIRSGEAIVTSPVRARSLTDSEGRFEFSGVPPGSWRLAACSEGRAPAAADADVTGGGCAEVRIELPAGADLEIAVLAEGNPVPGAEAAAWIAWAGTEFSRSGRPLRRGTTGPGGRLRLAGIPSDRSVAMVVEKAGFRVWERLLQPPLTSGPLRIELERGFELTGAVTDSRGVPLEGAEIVASQGGAYPAEARSGPDGAFAIGGLELRPVLLQARRAGYAPARLQAAGPASGVVIRLARTGGLAGRAGPGVAAVALRKGAETFRLRPGADREFRWTDLPPGPALLAAEDVEGRTLTETPVEVPEGAVLEGLTAEAGP